MISQGISFPPYAQTDFTQNTSDDAVPREDENYRYINNNKTANIRQILK